MPLSKLAAVVRTNAARNRREFVLSAFGIVVGIAAFVFFLGLSMGVRDKVLEVFPLERVEVVAPRASMLGVDMTKPLDDATVAAIEEQTVAPASSVVPRMALAFPTMVSGYFDGARLALEFVGDGIPPEYLADDPELADKFVDWEAVEKPEELASCGPAPRYTCEGLRYCDRRDMKCHHRVPVILSPNLLEIYNSQFAASRGLPVIGADLQAFIKLRGGLEKMRLYIDLGQSIVSGANTNLRESPRRVEGTLIGISDAAIPIGATVPLGYVERWNRDFVGEKAAGAYSSIIVTLENKDDVAAFASWVQSELGLRLEDSQGERFALIITIVTLLFVLIALVIVLISAINIAHNFFMQVSERRREIGLLRAIGATRRDVRAIFIGEAALLGVVAGVVGVGVGLGAGYLVDLLLATQVPDFPFKPESFFGLRWWIPASGLAVAVFFSVVGGALPARKAAKMQPARALSDR